MSTKLHPDLLRACAAYLAHADAYCLDSDGQMALLRKDAHRVAVGYGCEIEDAEVRMARWQKITGPSACDELTHAHVDAIRRHGQHIRVTTDRIVRTSDIALAIRDATPDMLAWWCERLER